MPEMIAPPLSAIATLIFGCALLHTFFVKGFQHFANQLPKDSIMKNFFHLLGEVEIIFGLWSGIFLTIIGLIFGPEKAIEYIESRDFAEPIFVFVIMVICSTKPILNLSFRVIEKVSHCFPWNRRLSFYISAMTLGTWLGSFITEPAAMTVVALILSEHFFKEKISDQLKYATLGLLFVNISIGGMLTNFAAPPVLMVSAKWGWEFKFMLKHFAWKSMIASLLSTGCIAYQFRKELCSIPWKISYQQKSIIPRWIRLVHLFFLALIIFTRNHITIFIGIFIFFLGLVSITRRYHENIKLREGLLVAFFLGGLVILGGQQGWWLEPVLMQLSAFPLYLGSICLTAFTDNAALTYLGSQVLGLSDLSKYALVSGSVVGGGLTVIANAPNPAGYGILNPFFGNDGISPFKLFYSALIPTLIAALFFWLSKLFLI